MKSLKQMLNEWAQKTKFLHEMTNDERIKLQSVLLEMLKDIMKVCDNNNLTILLAGGSCLGAIRHKGFIPWDDDLDVMMSRHDYEEFISILETGVLSEKYEFRYPDGKMDCYSSFLKIYKRDTIFGSIADSPYPKGVFLDIFPIDGVSSSLIIRKLMAFFANALRLISNSVAEYCNTSELMNIYKKESPELYKYMKNRLLIGKFFSFVAHSKWVYWFDRLVRNNKKTKYLTIPTGRKLYLGELNCHDVFFPPTIAEFEGINVYVPHDYDTYLKTLYGEYMEIPPVDKRERHFIETMKL